MPSTRQLLTSLKVSTFETKNGEPCDRWNAKMTVTMAPDMLTTPMKACDRDHVGEVRKRLENVEQRHDDHFKPGLLDR